MTPKPRRPGLESCGLPGDLLAKVTPRQVHRRLERSENPPPGRPRGRATHARTDAAKENLAAEFSLFVRPLSLVFVLTWSLVSWSFTLCISGADSLWTLSLPDSSLLQWFLTLLLPSRAALWFRARMSHRLLASYLSFFTLSLPMLCSCFSQLGLFRQGGPCLDL